MQPYPRRSWVRFAQSQASSDRSEALARRAGWPEAERDERREALHRVLTAATVHGADAGVHYYQGMHDVASVLLFVAGERPAYRMLCHLSTCHLRDCTRRVVASGAAAGECHDADRYIERYMLTGSIHDPCQDSGWLAQATDGRGR